MKSLLSLSLLLTAFQAQAFTLDFVGLEGSTLPPSPLEITVAGYGTVSFSPAYVDVLEVGTVINGMTTLQLDQNEAVIVTFLGANPTNVEFSLNGINAGEFANVIQLSGNSFIVSAEGNGNADGFGVRSVSWGTAVPEPSSALLGVSGVLALALRRRRSI